MEAGWADDLGDERVLGGRHVEHLIAIDNLGEVDQSYLVGSFSGLDRSGPTDPQLAWDMVDPEVTFTCMHCFHTWKRIVHRSDLVAGRLEPLVESGEVT